MSIAYAMKTRLDVYFVVVVASRMSSTGRPRLLHLMVVTPRLCHPTAVALSPPDSIELSLSQLQDIEYITKCHIPITHIESPPQLQLPDEHAAPWVERVLSIQTSLSKQHAHSTSRAMLVTAGIGTVLVGTRTLPMPGRIDRNVIKIKRT